MIRASTAISLLLAGSVLALQAAERNRQYHSGGYPATQQYRGGNYYSHPTGGGWFTSGGGYGYNDFARSSGVSRGGFGSIGNSMGAHC